MMMMMALGLVQEEKGERRKEEKRRKRWDPVIASNRPFIHSFLPPSLPPSLHCKRMASRSRIDSHRK
jgi:hypothetical protein